MNIEKLNERGFKGIWIDRSIWFCKDLTLQEKVFLVEIDSLDNDNGCFALNDHFEEFFDLKPTRVSRIISSLVNKGYITRELKYDGRKIKGRILTVVKSHLLNVQKDNPLLYESTNPSCTKVQDPLVQKYRDSNTCNNTDNNTTLTTVDKSTTTKENSPTANNKTTTTTNSSLADGTKKQSKDSIADDIYNYYINKTQLPSKYRYPTKAKLHIKKALQDSTKEQLLQIIDSYFNITDIKYRLTPAKFFNQNSKANNFYLDFKQSKKTSDTITTKTIKDFSDDDITSSISISGGTIKWKEKNRKELMDIKIDNPTKFNNILKVVEKIQSEENKNLYL